jgi:hypothetical protein
MFVIAAAVRTAAIAALVLLLQVLFQHQHYLAHLHQGGTYHAPQI